MKIIEIKKLEEFIRNIVKVNNDELLTFLFRGQAKDWPLHPKILRYSNLPNDAIILAEKYLFDEFKRKSLAFLEYQPDNDLEYLVIAQHFGLETRLLDWSENALTALWFALYNSTSNDDAVVWQYMSFNLLSNYISHGNNINPFDVKGVKFFKPPYIDKRIVNQNSILSIHELKNEKIENIPLNDDKLYNDKLVKYIVPNIFKNSILHDLSLCGINFSTVYPDLGGLCSNLNDFLKNKAYIRKRIDQLKVFMDTDVSSFIKNSINKSKK